MEKKYLVLTISVILIFLLAITLFFVFNFYSKILTAKTIDNAYLSTQINPFISNNNPNIQKFVLSFKDNYSPDKIRVKADIPVEITLDESVSGCYRNFIVDGLGIALYSGDPSVPIKFTPNKKGAFKFTCCSMDMGSGLLIVE